MLVHSPWTGFKSNEPYSITVPGLTNAGVDYEGGGCPLTAVSTSGDVLSDSISLSDVLKTLVWHGIISGQDYIGAADFGSEVSGGTGGLDINSLSYTWTANPSLVLAAGDNTLVISSMGGNNIIGNGGVDTVVYSGSYANYQIESSGSETLITNGNNISTMDELQGITYIRFSDGTYDIATGTFVSALVAPPVIVKAVVKPNDTVTLNGTAAANSIVTVYEGQTDLGTTSASASGAWSFTTAVLPVGAHDFTATATDAAGYTSGASNVFDPAIGEVGGSREIADHTTLVLGADAEPVTFFGRHGWLRLFNPSEFKGTVSDFRAWDHINMPGFAFDAGATLGYSQNSNKKGGTLSITDGTHRVQIALLGSYTASSFVTERDLYGGTIVATEASQQGNQSLLASPHHA